MKIVELNEGMYVVKSQDGVEKRFRDASSAEAKEWKASTSKKPAKKSVPTEKFTQEWWDYKEEKADGDGVYPWSKIGQYELDFDVLKDAFEQAGYGAQNIDDWSIVKKIDTKLNGVTTAAAQLRVVYVYTKDDDIGIEGDDPVSDSGLINVARSTKNPNKFIFTGYGNPAGTRNIKESKESGTYTAHEDFDSRENSFGEHDWYVEDDEGKLYLKGLTAFDAKRLAKRMNKSMNEGVLGHDDKKPSEYPNAKFDYDSWRAGKGPKPEIDRRIKKPDPSRWNDVERRSKDDE